MTATKCQAKNPALCVDPNCPEKKFHAERLTAAASAGDFEAFVEAKEAVAPVSIKIAVQDIQPGSIVGSGETVIDVHRRLKLPSNKREVYLRSPDGTVRAAVWGAYTEMYVVPPVPKPVTQPSATQ